MLWRCLLEARRSALFSPWSLEGSWKAWSSRCACCFLRSSQVPMAKQLLPGSKEGLLFIPLGGCNEIGMNAPVFYTEVGSKERAWIGTGDCFFLSLCMFSFQGKYLVVDWGISFDRETPMIGHILANAAFLKEVDPEDIVGILVTHNHEDHLGEDRTKMASGGGNSDQFISPILNPMLMTQRRYSVFQHQFSGCSHLYGRVFHQCL